MVLFVSNPRRPFTCMLYNIYSYAYCKITFNKKRKNNNNNNCNLKIIKRSVIRFEDIICHAGISREIGKYVLEIKTYYLHSVRDDFGSNANTLYTFQ
jgi:hypothetical protein